MFAFFYCCVAVEVPQDCKPSTGSGSPRKCLRVLGASCLGQGLGGSAPSCSQACPVLARGAGNIQEQLLARHLRGGEGGIWQRPPAAARKTSRCHASCCSQGSAPVWVVWGSMLFPVPRHESLLCQAQNNPWKSTGKELFSPFKSKQGTGKELGHVEEANVSENIKEQLLHMDVTLSACGCSTDLEQLSFMEGLLCLQHCTKSLLSVPT